MAHISALGAAMFSDLSISMPAADISAVNLAALSTAAEFQLLFQKEIASAGGTRAGALTNTSGVISETSAGTATFVRMANVRNFPPIGTPANIVKVPVYGQSTSSTIQGQADAPQLEVDINHVASDWAADGTATLLASALASKAQYVFRFTLLTALPTATTDVKYASTVAGLGTVANSQYYWIGKLEAMMVTPSLTDTTTAKLTLSIQSPFFGAYTI